MTCPGFPARAAATFVLLMVLPAFPVNAQHVAEDFARGQIINKVFCREDPNQSYALYLPSRYSPDRAWPILYCLDPGARGGIPVELFQEGAEKYGYIVVGSNNSRNGPFEICRAAMEAFWKDTHARFVVSEKRVFGAGMSGGARSMCGLAQMSGLLSGVIACAAGFPGSQVPKSVPYYFFGTAGTDDFNYPEVRQLDADLEKLGAIKRIVTFEGGHGWAPKSVCTQAIEWLELQSMKSGLSPRDETLIDSLFDKAVVSVHEASEKPGEAYLLNRAIAADFRGLKDVSSFDKEAGALALSKEVKKFFREEEETHIQQDRRGAELYNLWMGQRNDEGAGTNSFSEELSNLKKQSEGPRDSGPRRVARRVLYGLYVHAYEQARSDLEQKNFARAARLLELAAAIRPDSPEVYYNLASAYARAHDKRHALEALGRAIEKGFKDGKRISEDPAFEQLRNDPGLKKLLARLTGQGDAN